MRAFAALTILTGAVACSKDKSTPTPPAVCAVSAVTISPASASLVTGGTQQLNASVSATNCSTTPTITWSSSATSVASVSSSGLVSAVAAGNATISAVAGGTSGNAAITVTPPPIATLEITPSAPTTIVGGTVTLAAVAKDAQGNTLGGRSITWTSLAAAIATVTSAGVVTGVSAGTATITAGAEGKTAVVVVTITPPPVATVSVVLNSATLVPGQSTQGVATMRDGQGGELTGRAVTWQSSNTAVATVTTTGTVTAVAPGSSTISATSEGKSGSAVLTVSQVPVATVTISVGTSSMRVGDTQAATVTTLDAGGAPLTGRPIAFTSSNVSVLTVSPLGLISAVSPGVATVTATSEGKSAAATITVTPNVVALEITVPISTFSVGTQVQATAVAKDGAGNVVPGIAITFSSSNTVVASVHATTSLITALSTGTANITASSGALSKSVAVSVTSPVVVVESIDLTIPVQFLAVGNQTQASAVARDAAGNAIPNAVIAFASSHPAVASVSPTGTITALTPGLVTITASSGTASKSASLTILAPPPVAAPVASVTITRDSTYLAHGETGLVRVTFRDANNNVLAGRQAIYYDASGTSSVGGYTALPPSTAWVSCANEGGTCAFTGLKQVRYGANGSFVYRTVTGPLACVNGSFVADPALGFAKQCSYAELARSTTGTMAVTAAYCFPAGQCQAGVRTAKIVVMPVDNPLGVADTVTQNVVPTFVMTARTPTTAGPHSIEMTNTVTFSNNIQSTAFGGAHFALRETGSTTVINPTSWGVTNNVITYTTVLTEDRSYVFSYTNLLKDVYGKALTNPGSFTFTTVEMDGLYYYRLTSDYANAAGRSLAIDPVTRTCIMALTNAADAQQRWYAVSLGGAPGLDTRLAARANLRNQAYGSTRNLEGAALGGPCLMNPSGGAFTGEEWYTTLLSSGRYRMHTRNGGAGLSLDQPGGGWTAGLMTTGQFSGQAWFYVRVARR